jgi:hypothetical protein
VINIQEEKGADDLIIQGEVITQINLFAFYFYVLCKAYDKSLQVTQQ